MKKKVACGWILRSPANRILLLQNSGRGDWGLPKGHMEKGESQMQTALRELHEETGIDENQIHPDHDYKHTLNYSFRSKKGKAVNKDAVYFRAHCTEELAVTLSDEHTTYVWASLPQVIYNVSHNNLRHLILENMNTWK